MEKYNLRARGAATNPRTIQSLEGTKSVAMEKDNARDCEPLSSVISLSTSLTQGKEICKLATRTGLHCPNVCEDGKNLKTESSSSNSCRSYQEASPDGKKCCPKERSMKSSVSCNGQTTDVSSIDLNEDFHGNYETDHFSRRALMSRPVPVFATPGISVPSRLCKAGEGETRGWRGSAPTSAFKKYTRSKPSTVKGIDLNLPLDFDLNRASESNYTGSNDNRTHPFLENSRKRALPLYFPDASSFLPPEPLPSPGFRVSYVPKTTGLAFPGAFRGPGGDVAGMRPSFDLISRYHHQSGSLMEEQMRCFRQSAMSVSAFKRRELLGVRQVNVNVNPWG